MKLVNGLDPSPRAERHLQHDAGRRDQGAGATGRARCSSWRAAPATTCRSCAISIASSAANGPHVVHTHAWGTLLEGLVAARAARVPVVIHGEHGTLQLRGISAGCSGSGWSAADRVLSVSSRLAERMAARRDFRCRRITTIRNGVDLERFRAAEPRATPAASLAAAAGCASGRHRGPAGPGEGSGDARGRRGRAWEDAASPPRW